MKIGIRNTHQRLAYEATKYLPEAWRNVLLAHIVELLDGSVAPDRKFKDFRNHVLHPSPKGLRGGAIEAAKRRYSEAVEAAKSGDRKRFAFAMGVLSHYLADPTMPLHTAQEPGEENVHKFYERGTSELRRTRKIKPAERPKDIEELLADSARRAFKRYKDVMSLYDAKLGKPFKRRLGYKENLYEITQELLTLALSNIVTIRKRLVEELESQGVRPKGRPGLLTALKQALKAISEFLVRVGAERELAKMRKELIKYGSVISLDEEQIAYNELFEEPKALGLYVSPIEGKPVKKRFRLELEDPVEKAPGIGKKSGERLRKLGIETVRDLLEAPEEKLKKAIRSPEKVKIKARLMYEIPGLLARHAEALALAGIKSRKELLEKPLEELERRMQALKGKEFWGEPLALSKEELEKILERAKQGRDLARGAF